MYVKKDYNLIKVTDMLIDPFVATFFGKKEGFNKPCVLNE